MQKKQIITVGFLCRKPYLFGMVRVGIPREIHIHAQEAKIKSILLLEMETSGNLKGMEPTLGKRFHLVDLNPPVSYPPKKPFRYLMVKFGQ